MDLKKISFDDLSSLIKKSEEVMREQDSPVVQFYEKQLLTDKKFMRDIYKTLVENELLSNYHMISPEPTLHEILLYVYMIPYGAREDIPHYDNDIWEKWYYSRKRSKKFYYSKVDERDDGDTYLASLNVSAFVRKNIDMLNIASDVPKTEGELLRDVVNNVLLWSASASADGRDILFGRPLVCFPLNSMLSLSKKRAFFLIDLGVELYSILQTFDVEEVPLIIPKDILRKPIVGLSKSSVEVEVEYDALTENVELRSKKYHTVFDVISLASELADVGEDEREDKVNAIVEAIRAENRTFSNITAKDFSALSNILRLFIKNDDGTDTLRTSLGELSDATLEGIVKEDSATYRHKKECLLDTLGIIHKWASYCFDFGGMAGSGRITVINYVSGDYTNPILLAEAIKRGDIKGSLPGEVSSTKLLMDRSGEADVYEEMSYEELRDIPVTLELSSIFRKSLEYDQMSKQFTHYHNQLTNSNARLIYSFMELKRQELGYPSKLYVSYADFKDSFVIELRKKKFLLIIDRTLDELILLGAIKEYTYLDNSSTYIISF